MFYKNQTKSILLVGPRMRKPVLKVFAILILKFVELSYCMNITLVNVYVDLLVFTHIADTS